MKFKFKVTELVSVGEEILCDLFVGKILNGCQKFPEMGI